MKINLELALAFQIKHFIADYLLQTPYMLRKGELEWSFFFPLLFHCSVHGLFTLIICLAVNPSLWWLSIVDIVSHFFMDRIKANPKYLGRYTMKQPLPYWSIFGFDQMVHHVVGLFIAWKLIQ